MNLFGRVLIPGYVADTEFAVVSDQEESVRLMRLK